MANYTIIKFNKRISFDAEALNLKTVLRLVKIMEAKKKVSGYFIEHLCFDSSGLKELIVRKDEPDRLGNLLLKKASKIDTKELKFTPLYEN
jgi:hypothetical protein